MWVGYSTCTIAARRPFASHFRLSRKAVSPGTSVSGLTALTLAMPLVAAKR
jgi:hypothetical protein